MKNHDLVVDSVKDPALKAVLKWRYHSSNIATNNEYTSFSFSFSEVTKSEIVMEISKLKTKQASQISDISTKIIRDNTYLMFLCMSLNSSLKSWRFSHYLKLADITPLYKKGKMIIKRI